MLFLVKLATLLLHKAVLHWLCLIMFPSIKLLHHIMSCLASIEYVTMVLELVGGLRDRKPLIRSRHSYPSQGSDCSLNLSFRNSSPNAINASVSKYVRVLDEKNFGIKV